MNPSLVSPERRSLVWLAGGLAAGVLAVTLLGPALAARAQEPEPTPTIILTDQQKPSIQVSGLGRVFVKPDVADVSLGVVVQDESAQVASQEAATAMDAVIAALLELGIAEEDIQTTQLSLSPIYDWDRNPPRIDGWEAATIVRVTVRDVDTVGAVVDATVSAGATRIDGVTFRVEDTAAAESEARAAAMADARSKADQLAGAADVNITGVLSINEVSGPTPTPIYLERSMAAAEGMDAAATKVLPGEVEVQVSVLVTYEIE